MSSNANLSTTVTAHAAASRWQGKRALVLGLGETGLSLVRWLHARGAKVSVADSRSQPPGVQALRALLPQAPLHAGSFVASLLVDVDLVAISPGVSRQQALVNDAIARGIPVQGDVELFAQALAERAALSGRPQPRILAITGTNGKSTVTMMTGAMCRAAGCEVQVAGNISPAVLDALMARDAAGSVADTWVLELSSFQLESTESLHADCASMLNLSEDHLDRHDGMTAYAAAKQRVFHGDGLQVLNRDDPASMAMALPGRRVVSFGLDRPAAGQFGLQQQAGESWLAQGEDCLMPLSQLPLAGLHNAANALAALALCHGIGLPRAPLLQALREFRGLPHRVALVAEQDGVRYYDDSKGTNVGSTVAALKGLAQGESKVVLIAGGEGKGQDFAPLAEAARHTARAVVVIGRDAAEISQVLDFKGIFNKPAGTLADAVALARSLAQRGDAVLLSPACASFDMFRNYAHRGEVFCAVVKEMLDAGTH